MRKLIKLLKHAYKGSTDKHLRNKFIHVVKSKGLRVALLKLLSKVSSLDVRIIENPVNIPIYKNLIKQYIDNQAGRDIFLLFSHDLSRSGAPVLLLNIIKELYIGNNKGVILITLKGGELYDDFSKYCCILNLQQVYINTIENQNSLEQIFMVLSDFFISRSILNTIGGSLLIPFLEKYKFRYIILVHELFEIINSVGWIKSGVPNLDSLSNQNKLIFSSDYSYRQFTKNFDIKINKFVYPQGCMFINTHDESAKAILRVNLKIPSDSKIILGAGKDAYRKGVDIFYDMAVNLVSTHHNYYFIWIGDSGEKELAEIIQLNKNPQIIFINFIEDYSLFFAGADLFVLTSREDSFPNVVLDALYCQIPVLAFNECGGAPEILNKIDKFLIIEKNNLKELIYKTNYLLEAINKDYHKNLGIKARQIINEEYDFKTYVKNLISMFEYKVSVVIPNYNYEQYLIQRLESVINQTVKPFEIIFLDDFSSDNSINLAVDILKKSEIPYTVIANEKNEGVYNQWVKGIELASGDLIWIAEADDVSDRDFLKELVYRFNDSNVSIAYCQSRMVNEDNKIINQDILEHTDKISKLKWRESYSESGETSIKEDFLYRNIIVNVSAVLFRKSVFTTNVLSELIKFRYCGDWFLYVSLLFTSSIYYSTKVLNSFRRHNKSVTLNNNSKIDYLKELIKIKESILSYYSIPEENLQRSINFLELDYFFTREQITSYSQKLFKYLNKRKIVFISTNPSAEDGGGSEVLWIETALRMKMKGFDVAIMLQHAGLLKERVSILKNNGIKIYYKNKHGYQFLNEFNPELIVFSQGDHNEGTDWYEICKKAKINYMIINQLTKEGFWPDYYIGELVREFYLNAKKTFFTCENNKLLMEKQICAKLNNADRHYNPVTIPRDISLKYLDYNQGYYLAYPARMVIIHKGHDLLFEVMKQEKWKSRNLIINLYGDGPNKRQLENLKDYYKLDNIIFQLYQKNISNIWERNHGIIMPTRMEGMPIVLIGAMLSRRIPIVTNVGGHKEIIEDNVSGFIAKAPSVECIDEALENAWQNKEKWQEMGQKARLAILDFMPDDPTADFISKII